MCGTLLSTQYLYVLLSFLKVELSVKGLVGWSCPPKLVCIVFPKKSGAADCAHANDIMQALCWETL